MIVVFLALGTTDLIFALDSIPAIFGLTREPFIVFTANVFALMGLRQLYFLLGGLLKRLVYLSHGPRGDPGLHRREAGHGGAARERAAVHQRRRAHRGRPDDPDLALAHDHPGRRWSSPRWPACSRRAASWSAADEPVVDARDGAGRATGWPEAAAAAESELADEADEDHAAAEPSGVTTERRRRARLASAVMRPTDLALLRTPGVPTVSPDGRMAVVAVTRPDLEADEYRSQLWAVPTDGSAPARPLTSGAPGQRARVLPGRPLAGLPERRAGRQAAGLGAADRRWRAAPAHRPPPGRGRAGVVAGLAAAGLRGAGPRGRGGTAPPTGVGPGGRAAAADHHPAVPAGRRRLPRPTGRSQVFVVDLPGGLRGRHRARCRSRSR